MGKVKLAKHSETGEQVCTGTTLVCLHALRRGTHGRIIAHPCA
jgi:hypothetical protein